MGLYHGKQGTGVSVEAKVRMGPVTTLNLTQTGNGKLKLISGEGESTNGPIMRIGNTQTPVRFGEHPDAYLARWFAEAPTVWRYMVNSWRQGVWTSDMPLYYQIFRQSGFGFVDVFRHMASGNTLFRTRFVAVTQLAGGTVTVAGLEIMAKSFPPPFCWTDCLTARVHV